MPTGALGAGLSGYLPDTTFTGQHWTADEKQKMRLWFRFTGF
jgi:hypothetical protein